MGAAQHTVQVSGNTIYRSNDGLLPRKNLQVLRPPVDLTDAIDSSALARAIAGHFHAFDLREGAAEVALVFCWGGPPAAIRIAAFCRGLIEGLSNTVTSGRPIYLVFDHDLAGLVGTILKNDFELKNDLLAIDGVTLHDFDFIDLGKALEPWARFRSLSSPWCSGCKMRIAIFAAKTPAPFYLIASAFFSSSIFFRA